MEEELQNLGKISMLPVTAKIKRLEDYKLLNKKVGKKKQSKLQREETLRAVNKVMFIVVLVATKTAWTIIPQVPETDANLQVCQVSKTLMALTIRTIIAHMVKSTSCHWKNLEVEVLVMSSWLEIKILVNFTLWKP